jgi:hypothetical protein
MFYSTEILPIVRRDGDTNAVVVGLDTGDSSVAESDRYRHTIIHGLGRIPVGCQIILNDAPVNMYVMSSDYQKITIKFDASHVSVNIRIW